MADMKLMKELMETIRQKENGPQPYDTTAEVTRVEGSTAWVRIPGSDGETPVQMSINARAGDTVRVRVAGGQAWTVGNDTAPPTDDRTAEAAQETANTALEDAQRAAEAADAAEVSAAAAQASAEQAEESAETAHTAATSALTGLATVEDVVGTLNWISEHGTYAATSDAEAQPGKLYFTRTGSGTEADPYVYTVVDNPTGNPSTLGYYELTGVDEAVANYVATHLALTDEGLYIVSDASGYKYLVTNLGAYVISPEGNIVTTTDYHSLQLADKDGNTYFYASDLRNANGYAELTEEFTGDGTTTVFNTIFYPRTTQTCTVTVDGIEVEFTRDYKEFTLDSAPAAGASVVITYQSSDSALKAYTIGSRSSGSRVGPHSFGMGRNVTASGYLAIALNVATTAKGNYSLAEGGYSEANGDYSHAEGHSIASGMYSHAEGYGTEASGKYSHAEGGVDGLETGEASGEGAHSEGPSIASGYRSHAEGKSTASSDYSHSEGWLTEASGNYSHVEGTRAESSGAGAHAEGNGSEASGDYSHAEGSATASGDYSHAEGSAIANSNYSHAEGRATASGDYSHAEGSSTASGNYSHAQNWGTIAASNNQTAIGKFNVQDANNEYALIIGNGTGNGISQTSNALAVDWDGNVHLGLDTSRTATASVDYALYEAILALGWENDVID